MGLLTVWTIAEASNLALKAELMEKSPRNFSSFSRYSPQNNSETTTDKVKNAATRDPNPGNKTIGSSGSAQQSKAPIQQQNNPYVRPTGDTCFICNGKGHRSNVWPSRRVAAVADERDADDEREQPTVDEDEYVEVEFAEEEYDERVNFVLQRLLLASKVEGQRRNLFKDFTSG
jgi:hypothetical protein